VKTTVAQLVEQGADGRESVRAGLAELEEAGYLARARARQEHSQFGRTDYRLIIPGRPS
jgi:hypothetical protein